YAPAGRQRFSRLLRLQAAINTAYTQTKSKYLKMKRLSLILLAAVVVFFTSCDTTKEISLNKDGSGTIVTTSDMSSLIGIAKMSGQGKDLDELNDKAIDTSFNLANMADSLKQLTPEERQL